MRWFRALNLTLVRGAIGRGRLQAEKLARAKAKKEKAKAKAAKAKAAARKAAKYVWLLRSLSWPTHAMLPYIPYSGGLFAVAALRRSTGMLY
eukprot:SAG31_NODE_1830_length_7152_cov_2.148306_5_plen_92_part_00